MNTNQQFAVSCHILAILAATKNAPVTSEAIAASVNTNPVVIRRIMSHLRKHNLVDSRPGTHGGWQLMRPPHQISLRQVYTALSHQQALAMHPHPNPLCPIGSKIQPTLSPIFTRAQLALENELDQYSLATVLNQLLDPPTGLP